MAGPPLKYNSFDTQSDAAVESLILGLFSASSPLAYNNVTGTFTIQQSSAAQAGFLSAADWSTFNGKQNTLSFGNLTELTSSVLTIAGGTGAVIGSGTTILVKQATTAVSGYLSSTDWTTFNGKQNALSLPLSIANGGTNNAGPFTAGSVIFSSGTVLTQDNAHFFWDNTNKRLGIGTASPAYALQVIGDTSGGAVGPLSIVANGVTNTIGAALSISATAVGGHSYSFLSTGSGSGYGGGFFAFFDGTAGAYRMAIDPSGNVQVGSSQTSIAKFQVLGLGTTTGKNLAVLDSTSTTQFFIQDNGNLGWSGTPAAHIDVWTTTVSTTEDEIRITNATASATARHGLSWYCENNSKNIARLSASVGGGYVTNTFYIQVGDSSGTLQDRLAIDYLGRVGIGTTTPSALLNIIAGTAAAGTAPLKLTPGTLLTTPELGAIEFVDNGTIGHLYITLNIASVLTRVQIV